jgi:hypothetical protein
LPLPLFSGLYLQVIGTNRLAQSGTAAAGGIYASTGIDCACFWSIVLK